MAGRRTERARARVPVRVIGTQTGRVVRGKTVPDAEIDAVNLSASAADPTGFHDSVVIARSDARGYFAGTLPMRAGDVLRIRARPRRGPAGSWTVFSVRGLSGPPRPAQIAICRIGLRPLDGGTIRIFNLAPSRPIAAPGQTLAIVNVRTGDRVDLVIDDRGTFTGSPRIVGKSGDLLRVEATGRSKTIVGTLKTPKLSDADIAPSRFHQRVGFRPDLQAIRSPLFVRRPRAEDVVQSELPNCHIASASASLAHARPDLIERVIVAMSDGRYRVRFRTRDAATHSRVPRDVEISGELFVRPSGDLLYGSGPPGRRHAAWWPLLEKAIAQLKGSYKPLGDGGCADLVLELLSGRPARRFFIDAKAPRETERIWDELVDAFAERRPVVAGTSSYSPRTYRNTGLVPNHAYSVLSCRKRVGRRWVRIRNPWGEDAVAPCVPRKNGLMDLGLEEFVRLFCVISTVR